ncbi:MAG: PilT/PilU family type 4a pilus ATPase [Pseudomonadota bacterium]
MGAIDPFLDHMAEKNASDLYFTTGAPPSVKIDGVTRPITRSVLKPGSIKEIAYEIMSEEQRSRFERYLEMNLGLTRETGRFRVNIYFQRGEVSMVVRYIKSQIPGINDLGLPRVLEDIVMLKQGLILVVGSTGSGKSTSLAAMLENRNNRKTGHILTVEDPIEYLFTHDKSIIGQREVGLDTLSYENALREAMREAPDVIMIGEIRDRRTMEAAISYADTGHLCLSTLHAVNAYQALDRIINMFPPDAKNQVLMDLSLNLNSIVSQRLVQGKTGVRYPAVEVMIRSPYIAELIRRGDIHEIKDIMAKGGRDGMQTFDQSLYELYKANKIELETALENADSRGDLEWQINFGGGAGKLTMNDEADALEMPTMLDPGITQLNQNRPKSEGEGSSAEAPKQDAAPPKLDETVVIKPGDSPLNS